MADAGHIELERSVDSIRVGVRHRKDLGDLTKLIASIDELGLLQPITISPDGTLLCGRRRLEAIRHLEWRTVKVWVRSGLSDELHSLMAQQDDNVLHKPLSIIEAAALYEELKKVLAEDAARRQRATRFGASAGERDGGEESSPPSSPGKTREQASESITGKKSFDRLEQVNKIKSLADDESQPDAVRGFANDALLGISNGEPVNPWFRELNRMTGDAEDETSDEELDLLAREALERIKQPKRKRRSGSPSPPRKRTPRGFMHTWRDMDGWSKKYDANEVAREVSDEDWDLFERVIAETIEFRDEAYAIRNTAKAS